MTEIKVTQRVQRILVDVPSRSLRLSNSGGGSGSGNIPTYENFGDLVANGESEQEGSLAVTLDTKLIWERIGGVWLMHKGAVPLFLTKADLVAQWLNAEEGSLAIVGADKILYQKVGTNFIPAKGTVPSFASSAARDLAYGFTPALTLKGYACNLLDTMTKQRHDGTRWVGTPWTAFSYATGWSAYDSARPIQYRQDENGRVFMRGVGKKATSVLPGEVIGTLPVGFRVNSSTTTRGFAVVCGTGFCEVACFTTGIIGINFIPAGAVPNAYTYLDSVQFDTVN